MTRSELRILINQAHSALHNNDVEAAHDILHAAVSIEPGNASMSADPEVLDAVHKFNEYAAGKLACGHQIGDLIYSPDSITKCGACVQAYNARRNASMKEATEKRGVEW